MIPDVIRTILNYLSPHALIPYFRTHNISSNLLFRYNASPHKLLANHLNYIFDHFPNVILTGINCDDDITKITINACTNKVIKFETNCTSLELDTKCPIFGDNLHTKALTLRGRVDLSKLPLGLKSLTLQNFCCTHSIRDFSSLHSLLSITIIFSTEPIDPPYFPPTLKKISLTSCTQLKTIDNLPCSKLLSLSIHNCNKLWRIKNLPNTLTKFVATECPNLTNINSVLKCPNLHTLIIQDCPKLDHPTTYLHSNKLKHLEFQNCAKFWDMKNFLSANSINLRYVTLRNCGHMINLSFQNCPIHTCILHNCADNLNLSTSFQNCHTLHTLQITRCGSLSDPDLTLTKLPNLYTLDLDKFTIPSCFDFAFSHTPHTPHTLRFHRSPHSINIHNLGTIQTLKSLTITESPLTQYICELPPNLESLTILDCRNLKDITPHATNLHSIHLRTQATVDLRNCPILKYAILDECSINSISWFSLTQIQNLTLIKCNQIEQIILSSKTLQHITLNNCSTLKYLDELNGCHALISLTVTKCQNIQTIPYLNPYTQLQFIAFEYNPKLENISNLNTNPNIKAISLIGCNQLSELPPLNLCTNLEYINLDMCEHLNYISSLNKCVSLKYIIIGTSSAYVTSLICSNLQFLGCSGKKATTKWIKEKRTPPPYLRDFVSPKDELARQIKEKYTT